MKNILLTTAVSECALLPSVPAFGTAALPVLTLTERDDRHLDWIWSDGTGSGTLVTTTPDLWNGVSIPLPSGISDSFYGRWAETFPGYRNGVHMTSSGPGLGTLYVTSDFVDFSPSLAALGSALPSDNRRFEVIFKDLGDHHVTPDAMSTAGILAGSFAGLTLIHRSKSVTRGV